MAKSSVTNPIMSSIKKLQEHNKANSFVCIGHFDVISIDELKYDEEHEFPLDVVQKDCDRSWNYEVISKDECTNSNITEENYYYPIYLIKQIEQNNIPECVKSLEDFWNLEMDFVAITRFHKKNNVQKIKLVNELKQRLRKNSKDLIENNNDLANSYVYTVRCNDGDSKARTKCVLYDSLELGDVVSIVKSDSLVQILKTIRELYLCNTVSDAYSYCGLNCGLFTGNLDNEDKKILKQSKLDYASIRFSISNAKMAYELINKLGRDGYFITGNADAIVEFKKISEHNFVGFLVKIARNKNCDLYIAFKDIVSRIGLNNIKPNNSRNPQEDKKLIEQQTQNNILYIDEGILVWLNKKINQINFPSGDTYIHSFKKLLCTLKTMSENCVVNDLSLLLIDGVRALIDRLGYLSQYEEKWIDSYSVEIQEFLDRWTALINSILHIESQLLQYPELVPVRYYIPAMVLQFEKVIVKKCVSIFDDIDPSHRFEPIIFPCSQTQALTKAVLDPKNDTEYKGKCPLSITIPIHQLYCPWEISHVLCHEVAHYCGNEIRFREDRLNYITNSIADYMLCLWDMVLSVSNDKAKKVVFESCRQYIAKQISEAYRGADSGNGQYLESIENGIPYAANVVIMKQDVQNRVLRDFISFCDASEQLEIVSSHKMDDYYVIEEMTYYIKEHTKDCLISLYKECFADIVMICLLKCSFIDYYNCVYKNEYQYLNNMKERDYFGHNRLLSLYEHHTDRLAIVTLVISQITGFENWNNNGDIGIDWINAAISKIVFWNRKGCLNNEWSQYYCKDKFLPSRLLGYEAAQLIEYLVKCANHLWKSISRSEKVNGLVDELRNTVKYMNKGTFDWNKLQDICSK